MTVQYTGHVIQTEARDNNTALPLVGVLVTWSGRINDIINYIYFIILKFKNYLIQITIGAHLSFSDSSVISLFSDWLHICII